MNATKSKPSSSSLLPLELVTHQIKVLRGQRVIVDSELAARNGVETKRLDEAVKRNAEKFPADFMFVTTPEEFEALRSQIATSNEGTAETPTGRGGQRYLPRVFTEHGALMAATVLSSPRAVEVSIHVVRAFVELRKLANTHQGLATRLDALEEKTEALAMSHDTFSRNTRNQLRQILMRCVSLPHRLRHHRNARLASSRMRTRRTRQRALPKPSRWGAARTRSAPLSG